MLTTTYRLANKLLHSATSCISELEDLKKMILDDYVTMTGCDYDTSCILPACTEKSDECNELYDCSTLSTAEDSVTTSCDIIVSES